MYENIRLILETQIKDVIVCMDMETALKLYSEFKDVHYDAVRVHNTFFADDHIKSFKINGINTHIICERGIGWFIGDLAHV